jgi:adenosylcobinamide-GDP ribazoletransferase
VADRPAGDGLRLALTTLTVVPVRGPHALDRRTAGWAMALAPAVGLLLGLTAAAVLVGARAAGPEGSALLPAALAVAALAGATRGLHLDGLADTVDGLGSYLTPAGARAVMKAPDLGPLGMAAVALGLLVQTAALAQAVAAGRGVLAVVLAVVCGRLAVSLACTPATPPAAPSGLGHLVAGTVPGPVAGGIALLVGGAAAVAGALDDGGTGLVRAVLAVAAGLLAAHLLRRHAVRRLGGVSGDLLGALVETTTTVVLVGMALGPA